MGEKEAAVFAPETLFAALFAPADDLKTSARPARLFLT